MIHGGKFIFIRFNPDNFFLHNNLAATYGMKYRQVKRVLAMARIHCDAKTARLQELLHEEHKAIVRKYNRCKLTEGSILENINYTFLNRLWRFIAALNRCIYRGDLTLGRVSRTLKIVKQASGSPFDQ